MKNYRITFKGGQPILINYEQARAIMESFPDIYTLEMYLPVVGWVVS